MRALAVTKSSVTLLMYCYLVHEDVLSVRSRALLVLLVGPRYINIPRPRSCLSPFLGLKPAEDEIKLIVASQPVEMMSEQARQASDDLSRRDEGLQYMEPQSDPVTLSRLKRYISSIGFRILCLRIS